MGHYTAFVRVSVEEFEAVAVPRHLTGYGLRSSWSKLDEVVSLAAGRWRETEAERYADARLGTTTLLSAQTPEHAYDETNPLYEGIDARSYVVPVVGEADVITAVKTIPVSVDATTLRRVQAQLAAGSAPAHLAAQMHPELQALDGLVSALAVKAPKQQKARAVATEGAATTIYEVHGPERFPGKPNVLATGATTAEARAKALKLAEANPALTRLAIRGRIVRAVEEQTRAKTSAASTAGSFAGKHNSRPDGGLSFGAPIATDSSADLVVIERPVAEDGGTVQVQVTTKTARSGAKPEHYVVVFDYHS